MPNTHTAGELKACPFCGAGVYICESGGAFFAACSECYCNVGEAYDRDAVPMHMFSTEAEAITAWNTRAVDTELLEALKDARTTLSIMRTNAMTEIGRCADASESRWAGVPEQLAKRIAAIDAAITKAEAGS